MRNRTILPQILSLFSIFTKCIITICHSLSETENINCQRNLLITYECDLSPVRSPDIAASSVLPFYALTYCGYDLEIVLSTTVHGAAVFINERLTRQASFRSFGI